MTSKELKEIRLVWLNKNAPYTMAKWTDYDFNILKNIMYIKRAGRGDNARYADCIIMADTETSKKNSSIICENHVCAWTISIRSFNRNIVTLYGTRPSEMITCIDTIKSVITCDKLIIYFHNYAYDYVFLRLFMFRAWNYPVKQLNTNSHYPIYMEFANGIVIRDSLILSQRALEKWANDLDVVHKKAVGKWNYDKVRNQGEEFTTEELEYMENDTLSGVECLQKTMDALNKRIYSLPYTATGIPREEVRKRGLANRAHEKFIEMCPTYQQQMKLEAVYHGGYTHAYRDYVGYTIDWDIVQAQDFASSYPYTMLAAKFPKEKFFPVKNKAPEEIVELKDSYAYMFKFIAVNIKLKNNKIHMPALQFSKMVNSINPIVDNGRVLCAGYVEIYLTEMDLAVILEQYDYTCAICVEVECAAKGYLPRWFTDYVFQCFVDKTKLKGGDPILYSIAKARLNSLYGMCVQKPIRENIVEDYLTGDYSLENSNPIDIYEKFRSKHSNVLSYQVGVWVTAYAFYNLFQLGKCCSDWIYSDTDSCYGIGWDMEKLQKYNDNCISALRTNGYEGVRHNGRIYYPGIAESNGNKDKYTEFRVMGAKRYCGRCVDDGKLHITVAGVPKKKGALALNDNIENFKRGLIFKGEVTGKNTHTYFFLPDATIYTDSHGNETGDSVDLSPCDYELDMIECYDWEKLFTEEVTLPAFFEEEING